MSTAAKTVDHMKILKDMGDGLLNRLYHLKGALLSKSKPSCLVDSDTAKIRIKIEKKFPLLPETQKVCESFTVGVTPVDKINLLHLTISKDPGVGRFCRLFAHCFYRACRSIRTHRGHHGIFSLVKECAERYHRINCGFQGKSSATLRPRYANCDLHLFSMYIYSHSLRVTGASR